MGLSDGAIKLSWQALGAPVIRRPEAAHALADDCAAAALERLIGAGAGTVRRGAPMAVVDMNLVHLRLAGNTMGKFERMGRVATLHDVNRRVAKYVHALYAKQGMDVVVLMWDRIRGTPRAKRYTSASRKRGQAPMTRAEWDWCDDGAPMPTGQLSRLIATGAAREALFASARRAIARGDIRPPEAHQHLMVDAPGEAAAAAAAVGEPPAAVRHYRRCDNDGGIGGRCMPGLAWLTHVGECDLRAASWVYTHALAAWPLLVDANDTDYVPILLLQSYYRCRPHPRDGGFRVHGHVFLRMPRRPAKHGDMVINVNAYFCALMAQSAATGERFPVLNAVARMLMFGTDYVLAKLPGVSYTAMAAAHAEHAAVIGDCFVLDGYASERELIWRAFGDGANGCGDGSSADPDFRLGKTALARHSGNDGSDDSDDSGVGSGSGSGALTHEPVLRVRIDRAAVQRLLVCTYACKATKAARASFVRREAAPCVDAATGLPAMRPAVYDYAAMAREVPRRVRPWPASEAALRCTMGQVAWQLAYYLYGWLRPDLLPDPCETSRADGRSVYGWIRADGVPHPLPLHLAAARPPRATTTTTTTITAAPPPVPPAPRPLAAEHMSTCDAPNSLWFAGAAGTDWTARAYK
jgi:hypothetical protein